MRDASPQAVYLSDYQPPAFVVENLELDFDLAAATTEVTTRMAVRRNPQAVEPDAPLRLYGDGVELVSLSVDGVAPAEGLVEHDADGLLLHGLKEAARLEIVSHCHPEQNTALEGLYASSGNLCTQCEPEGFRRITFFPDRPDVLTTYRVRLEADRAQYPVLLANGNRVEAGELDGGRHYAVWEDPFPKPSYLFALVAGDLACQRDTFATTSGREVALELFVEAHNADRCDHALASLKRAMRYDEEAFGREYDLDVYMIVAVDDFNMGAMENKGLNLFNAKYVLASPDTATDSDFVAIESVIAHEYFHNWSGNRVTCRDWFQLSLKEGLTVFRDQEFTTDCTLFGVKRIDDVAMLRAFQFPEDAGPLAHPVRPDHYAEINNFYTLTVYEKGAELIRMLRTLIGRETFRRGLDLYFERFDGQAVTTDDFVAVMAEASGRDLSRFKRWYTQAGTPHVTAGTAFDGPGGPARITLAQETPTTPGQPHKEPLVVPMGMAFLDADGQRIRARREGDDAARDEWVLELDAAEHTFCFEDLSAEVAAISWLRGFSAPVILNANQGVDELAHLLAHDDDAFSRWEAAQTLFRRAIRARIEHDAADSALEAAIEHALHALIEDPAIEPVLLATILQLPPTRELAELFERVDPVRLRMERDDLEKRLYAPLAGAMQQIQPKLDDVDNGAFTAEAMGLRQLRNRLLALRVAARDQAAVPEALAQYQKARSMTMRMGALNAVNELDHEAREVLLTDFEQRYRDDPLVLDKYFGLQAGSQVPGGFERLEALLEHPGFRWTNPNRVRAVLGPFMARNERHFHQEDGEGYRRMGGFVEKLDAMNPQTAARLAQPLTRWQKVDSVRGGQMRAELERLAALGLSRDLRDVIERALAE
ncbi:MULTISPECIES: aminopeptidase N [unclassified Thioalkalivibrio]|uniref:aminopeptidase N n=1 Tax=unclassified Thioalkalivibrio TaxID=2621013 RepID=UPI00036A52E3|nr:MULTISPECIES: aminopeptidase N [unclassified Thioalkalivibrio]